MSKQASNNNNKQTNCKNVYTTSISVVSTTILIGKKVGMFIYK